MALFPTAQKRARVSRRCTVEPCTKICTWRLKTLKECRLGVLALAEKRVRPSCSRLPAVRGASRRAQPRHAAPPSITSCGFAPARPVVRCRCHAAAASRRRFRWWPLCRVVAAVVLARQQALCQAEGIAAALLHQSDVVLAGLSAAEHSVCGRETGSMLMPPTQLIDEESSVGEAQP